MLMRAMDGIDQHYTLWDSCRWHSLESSQGANRLKIEELKMFSFGFGLPEVRKLFPLLPSFLPC